MKKVREAGKWWHVCFCCVLLSMAQVSPLYANLLGDELAEMIIGNTVHMIHLKKDVEFDRYFSSDGKLAEFREGKGYRFGEWNIQDEMLCISLPGASAKCRQVIRKNGEYGTANRKSTKIQIVFESFKEGNHLVEEEILERPVEDTVVGVTEQLVTINTREGVTQTFLLIEPAEYSKGVVVLYPGHEGVDVMDVTFLAV